MAKLACSIGGVGLVAVGVLCLGYWVVRLFHPTAADRARMDAIAEFGGTAATAPADPKKAYLLGGAAAIMVGGGLLKSRSRF